MLSSTNGFCTELYLREIYLTYAVSGAIIKVLLKTELVYPVDGPDDATLDYALAAPTPHQYNILPAKAMKNISSDP